MNNVLGVRLIPELPSIFSLITTVIQRPPCKMPNLYYSSPFKRISYCLVGVRFSKKPLSVTYSFLTAEFSTLLPAPYFKGPIQIFSVFNTCP